MGMVRLFVGSTSLETQQIRDHLEAQGFRAIILGENLGMGRGELPITAETLPAVYVDSENAAASLAAVKEFLEQPLDQSRPPWPCPSCGEQIEGQFDACWHCGTTRPTDLENPN